MLEKTRRIKGGDVFNDIYKNGDRFFSKHFTLFLKKNKGKSGFACVVSKKVSKKAVLRNKLRRRCYSAIRKNLPYIKEGYFFIILLKGSAAGLSISELEKNLMAAFKQKECYSK